MVIFTASHQLAQRESADLFSIFCSVLILVEKIGLDPLVLSAEFCGSRFYMAL